MEDRRRLPPKMRGVKKRNGRKYIWLLNHEGKPEKHFLDQYGSKTKRPKDES